MLSRRFIRIKTMQALYGYFHSEDKSAEKFEKDLFQSMERSYDLYLYLLLLLGEIRESGRNLIAIRKVKRLPTAEDINPNTRFVDNRIFGILAVNKQLASATAKRKLSWEGEKEIPQKLFNKILDSDIYRQYMNAPAAGFKADRKFVADLYREIILPDEHLQFIFEEWNIHWADDIDFVNTMVLKTLESIPEGAGDRFDISPLYKDEKEDTKFARDLFRMVIKHSEEEEKEIQEKTENWELERIAFMDVLLMKMAITEFLHLPTIPVKVTMNEYIELAKQYSTPKSSIFVNGILDKLLSEYKSQGRLKKVGRGLVEN